MSDPLIVTRSMLSRFCTNKKEEARCLRSKLEQRKHPNLESTQPANPTRYYIFKFYQLIYIYKIKILPLFSVSLIRFISMYHIIHIVVIIINHLDNDSVIRTWSQEIYFLCDFRFEPCGCLYDGHWRLTWSLTSGPVGLVEVHASWPGHPR
jgi:hypothetical protein